MNEIEKLKRAKMYIDKLVNGKCFLLISALAFYLEGKTASKEYEWILNNNNVDRFTCSRIKGSEIIDMGKTADNLESAVLNF